MQITLDAATLGAAVAKQGRRNRNPKHDFYLEQTPWAIQPFMIAPVLPGETMKNGLLQSRAVTDPIKSKLIGWHMEYYVFYVKLRDLDIRDAVTTMLLTPGSTLPAWTGAGTGEDLYRDKHNFLATRGINWVRYCLNRVVAEYFRDEGDAPAEIGAAGSGAPGLPPATFQTREYWHDSARLHSATVPGDDGQLPGEDDYADANIPAGWAAHYEQYERMRALKLTEVTFDDWLRQFGVTPPKEVREELHKPELLRYVRDWSYPSNTINPSNGAATTAVSWSIAERLDKARFFAEPGFIFGVSVCRPKVYLGRQRQPAVEMLNDAFSWLPAVLAGDPYTSLKKFETTAGPLGHVDGAAAPSEAYWVDVRDLFLYGDSFANVWVDQTAGVNKVLRPAQNLERRYATTADADALFVTPVGSNKVRQDGVFELTIAGHQTDHT